MAQQPITANFFPTQDPQQQAAMVDLMRKQLMAQQLLDNSAMPGSNDMAGNVVVAHSPLEYLSKAISGAEGRKLEIQALKDQYSLQGQQMAALLGSGGPAGGGSATGNPVSDSYRISMIAHMFGPEAAKAYADRINAGPITADQEAAKSPYASPVPIPDSNGAMHYMNPHAYNLMQGGGNVNAPIPGLGGLTGAQVPPVPAGALGMANNPPPIPQPGISGINLGPNNGIRVNYPDGAQGVFPAGTPQSTIDSSIAESKWYDAQNGGIPHAPVPDNMLPEFQTPIPARTAQSPMFNPQIAAAPDMYAQANPVIGVGPSDAQKAALDVKKAGDAKAAEETATKLADVANTTNIMQSNLPMALQRFQQMRDAADKASYGLGVDNEGEGIKQQLWNQFGGETSSANNLLQQKAAQGVLPELGPQLAQAGVKGNKFLESLATQASGLNMSADPASKTALIDGLETTYINNLKSSAAQLRQMGKPAPSEADIDKMVQQYKNKIQPPKAPAGPTKTINGKTYVNHNGQWYEQ